MAEREPKKRSPKKVNPGPKGGRKHTPGRDHDSKSGAAKKKRFAKRQQRKSDASHEGCREQWKRWNALPDLHPDCPRPNDEPDTGGS